MTATATPPLCPQALIAHRERIADLAFAHYQFGQDVHVEQSGSWNRNDPDDFTKLVTVSYADAPGAEYQLSFHARFEGKDLVEAYALDLESGVEVGAYPVALPTPDTQNKPNSTIQVENAAMGTKELRFTLTISGTINPTDQDDPTCNPLTVEALRENLLNIVERTTGEGMFTGDTSATVEEYDHAIDVIEATPGDPVILSVPATRAE